MIETVPQPGDASGVARTSRGQDRAFCTPRVSLGQAEPNLEAGHAQAGDAGHTSVTIGEALGPKDLCAVETLSGLSRRSHGEGEYLSGLLKAAIGRIDRIRDPVLARNYTQSISRSLTVLAEWHPSFRFLRARLARALFVGGDLLGAIGEIRLLAAGGRLRSVDVLLAADVSMNIGELQQAEELLATLTRSLSGDSAGNICLPSDDGQRVRELASAKCLAKMWVPCFRQNHAKVVANGAKLLGLAERAGAAELSGVLHRLGRAQFDHAVETGNRHLMSKALASLRRAAGEARVLNPHSYLAQYMVVNALQDGARRWYWDQADEIFRRLPAGMRAHQQLHEARWLREERRYPEAIELLEEALAAWAAQPYPKGAFDAFFELGGVWEERGGLRAMTIASSWYLLAAEIGDRIAPALADGAGRRFDRCAARAGAAIPHIQQLASDAISSFPLLSARHHIPVPVDTAGGSSGTGPIGSELGRR
jgi:tetratricopeptide (TPR) repeat protein